MSAPSDDISFHVATKLGFHRPCNRSVLPSRKLIFHESYTKRKQRSASICASLSGLLRVGLAHSLSILSSSRCLTPAAPPLPAPCRRLCASRSLDLDDRAVRARNTPLSVSSRAAGPSAVCVTAAVSDPRRSPRPRPRLRPSAASCCAGAPTSSSRPPAAPVGAVLIPKEAGTQPSLPSSRGGRTASIAFLGGCRGCRCLRRRWSMRVGWSGMVAARSGGPSSTCATSCWRPSCCPTTSANPSTRCPSSPLSPSTSTVIAGSRTGASRCTTAICFTSYASTTNGRSTTASRFSSLSLPSVLHSSHHSHNHNHHFVFYLYCTAHMMAAFNIQEALIWKEKIEMVIDQQQGVVPTDGNIAFSSSQQKAGLENGRKSSSSDHESQYSHEEEEEEEDNHQSFLRRTTIENGPPESLYDWTRENDTGISNQGSPDQVFSRRHWRLVRCQNGLHIFEELQDVDYLARSCSRAMKAVGVVEASCEAVFQLVMSMDTTRFEWDCSFQYGSLVEEVDGHTAILYHRLQLDWFSMFVWPRDLCYVRYWRRNDDGSYVVLFQSREHPNCGPQPGFVRAHIESGGFNISPLKYRNGRIRTQVQHLMQIDLKGWGVGYLPSFQQHCLLHMLNSVAGLREWFSQSDESQMLPRIPVMANMAPSVSSMKGRKAQDNTVETSLPMDQSRHFTLLDEESDEDEDFQLPETEPSTGEHDTVVKVKQSVVGLDEDSDQIDLSGFSGNLHRDDRDNSRDCWRISDGNNFRVRSKNFIYDKSKVPAGKPLMELVAVDWFKDAKRMDHVARRKGCAVQVAAEKGLFALAMNLQVPGTTNYSMVFYFVTKKLILNSLLQRFVDGDDEFRNSRFKLIPSVPKGSWIVRQSVGSTPCLLGKAVDITYIRGANYLEIDVDIGSSTVANGVLGLVCGVITTLVVDMAFLVQGNTYEELPERLVGAVRMSHIELSSAIVPVLED